MSVGHRADLVDLIATGDRHLTTQARAGRTYRVSAPTGTVAL